MYQIMPNPDWAIVANWAILDLEIRIFGHRTDIIFFSIKSESFCEKSAGINVIYNDSFVHFNKEIDGENITYVNFRPTFFTFFFGFLVDLVQFSYV